MCGMRVVGSCSTSLCKWAIVLRTDDGVGSGHVFCGGVMYRPAMCSAREERLAVPK